MKLEQSNLIVKRAYKEVYKCDEGIVKVFEKTHSKADVFNEALNTAQERLKQGRVLCTIKATTITLTTLFFWFSLRFLKR